MNLRHHWCWVPGPRDVRPVYAPALVGWAGNPPSRYSAIGRGARWFPLAPHEVYVPSYMHTPRHARRVNQANTVIDDAKIARAYTARDRVRDYRHRADVNAVTVGDVRDATPRRRVAERELDAARAAAQASVPRPAEDSSAPRAAGAVNRPAPATTTRPPASYSPAAPSPQGSAASAPQSSRREAREATPSRSSQPQPRDASRPTYQQP